MAPFQAKDSEWETRKKYRHFLLKAHSELARPPPLHVFVRQIDRCCCAVLCCVSFAMPRMREGELELVLGWGLLLFVVEGGCGGMRWSIE